MSTNPFYPESEIVYLLMEFFSSKGKYIPNYISTKYENKFYISNNSRTRALRCSKINWKTRITRFFPSSKQRLVRNSLRNQQKHYDIELSYDKNHRRSNPMNRHWYIEAKGDYCRDGRSNPFIKGQIEKGLGQLILGGRYLNKNYKYWGVNYCLAIPSWWEPTLKHYLTFKKNRFYKQICKSFGRKKKSMIHLGYFLVDRYNVEFLRADLSPSTRRL